VTGGRLGLGSPRIKKKEEDKWQNRRCVCWFLCASPPFKAISLPFKKVERAEICSM